jgi:hypothetical protein
MIDKSTVNAGTGFYQSSTNSIVWTPDQDPTLATAAPGASGQLQFSFGTLAPGQGGVVYTNPTATLSLSIAGQRQADQGGVPGQVTAAAVTQVQFASAVSLTQSAQYLSGSRPPVAESSSVYGIQWVVKNSSNAVGSATVSTVLPPYVSFISGGEGISYDAASRTVVWQLGDVKAGAGYTSVAVSNSFEVTLTPSVSQINTAPPLTGTAALSGTDRFANTRVGATAGAPTTVDNVQPKP